MLPLPDVVRLNARRVPERVAVVDENGRLTHAELTDRAMGLARGLFDLGVRPRDRVGVLSANSNFAIETLLGIVLVGATYVPFNWRWATAELVHGIELTRPRVVLVEERFREAAEEAVSTGKGDGRLPEDLVVRYQDEDYPALLAPGGDVGVSVHLDDPLCILFTGGTTGRSKGVVLTHRSGMTNAINELVDCGFGRAPYNTGANITPLFHSAALLCVFLPNYVTGGTNVNVHRFDEHGFPELVEREGINSTFIIPNMIRRLLKAGAFEDEGLQANLKQLHSGGGLLRMPDKEAVLGQMPQLELFFRYGLTECGPMVSRLLPEDILRPELDGSIGKEYTFTEVQVRGPGGAELPPGQLGEICVKGPNVMDRYFDRPEDTTQVLRDGWLHTGDLAVRDEEGYLFFRDRAKDMIKTGGENVYAAEIEQLLYAHPAVMECGVLGVESERWGEEVRAVVALREADAVAEEELRSYLREHLAGYKVPKVFAFVEPKRMPVNPSGKVVKHDLREMMDW